MTETNEYDVDGTSASCFVCEDGGDVRVDADATKISTNKDSLDMNISLGFKCFVCGETKDIGFRTFRIKGVVL